MQRWIVFACALFVCGTSHATFLKSTEVAAKRQTAYQMYQTHRAELQQGCGRRKNQKEVAVFFPLNNTQQFYVDQDGIWMFVRISGKTPTRVWCAQESSETTAKPAARNAFWSYLKNQKNPMGVRQLGQLPTFVGRLEKFSSFAQEATYTLLSSTGKAVCQRNLGSQQGLSDPLIQDASCQPQ